MLLYLTLYDKVSTIDILSYFTSFLLILKLIFTIFPPRYPTVMLWPQFSVQMLFLWYYSENFIACSAFSTLRPVERVTWFHRDGESNSRGYRWEHALPCSGAGCCCCCWLDPRSACSLLTQGVQRLRITREYKRWNE